MKKLFVLFLLVALVPFTVGCGLWGSDDDAPVTYPTTWKATVKAPAVGGLNLLAAVPVTGDTYFGYTITINGVVLPIVDVTGQLLSFSKVIEGAEVAKMTAAQAAGADITVTISSPAGAVQTFTYKLAAKTTGDVSIDYSTGKPVVKFGTTAVPSLDADTAAGAITAVTGYKGAVEVPVTLYATSEAAAAGVANEVASASGKITFDITADTAFDVANGYYYTVKVNGTEVKSTDFAITQTAAQLAAKKATITLVSTARVIGTEYTVVITTLVVDGIPVTAQSFKFKFI